MSAIENARWNGQPARAQRGTVIVGRAPAKTWWCASQRGDRLPCVRVEQGGKVFFIDDSRGIGTVKVRRGGWPDDRHATIPVDQPDTFEPEA